MLKGSRSDLSLKSLGYHPVGEFRDLCEARRTSLSNISDRNYLQATSILVLREWEIACLDAVGQKIGETKDFTS